MPARRNPLHLSQLFSAIDAHRHAAACRIDDKRRRCKGHATRDEVRIEPAADANQHVGAAGKLLQKRYGNGMSITMTTGTTRIAFVSP